MMAAMELPAEILQSMKSEAGMCFPDWERVGEEVRSRFPEERHDEVWGHVERFWLFSLQQVLGKGYAMEESENFVIVAKDGKRRIKRACKAYEKTLVKMRQFLGELGESDLCGKIVLLFLENRNVYDRYFDGVAAGEEVAYLSGAEVIVGIKHMVFDEVDYAAAKPLVVGNLTSKLTSGLELPIWLESALDARMVSQFSDSQVSRISANEYELHEGFWSAETIQDFWCGRTWDQSWDSQPLSISLANMLWQKMELDLEALQEELIEFIDKADVGDAGEAAFIKVFEHSLGDLVSSFLGDGDWAPKPEVWAAEGFEDEEGGEAYEVQSVRTEDFESQEWMTAEQVSRLMPELESGIFRYVIGRDDEDLNDSSEENEMCLFVHREDLERFHKLCRKVLKVVAPSDVGSGWKARLKGGDFLGGD